MISLVLCAGATAGFAAEPVRICMSAGSEADGVSAMIHHADDRAIRVDSPYSDDPQSVVTRWSDAGYFARLWATVEPRLGDLPEDALASCDDGWRDTLVVTFDDGTVLRRDASCMRNPVFLLRNEVANAMPSLVENATRERTDGPIDGIYDPCGRAW